MTWLCQDILSKTGRVVFYSANITCDFLHVEEILQSLSGLPPSIMVDAIPMGLSAIAWLRHKTAIPIYVHRTMYRALYQSIKPHVLLFLMRVYGADVLHIGNPAAEHVRKDFMRNLEAIRERSKQTMKSCLPVITGVGVENVTACIEAVGPDVLLMCCGGLYRGQELERQIESLRSKME
jgi:ribulose 1,5-bisphosphate carboxylase large subunit-like protein